MPGFAVQGIGGRAGSGVGGVPTQEFLYNYTWEIFQLLGNSNNLLIYSKEMTLPTFSVGIENQQGASLEYKFAKSVSWDDIKITFYDSSGLIAILKEWRTSVWTVFQGLATADAYKKISSMGVYTPEWDIIKGQLWNLTGSWPSTIRHGDLTYTSSDVKIVEVTITYDFAETVDVV